jgi:class 3 adenylate cyclase
MPRNRTLSRYKIWKIKTNFLACVVFADVSGFTALTDKLASIGPEGVEKLTNHLNTYFDALIGTIYRYGGDIVKVSSSLFFVHFFSLLEMLFYVYGLQLLLKDLEE